MYIRQELTIAPVERSGFQWQKYTNLNTNEIIGMKKMYIKTLIDKAVTFKVEKIQANHEYESKATQFVTLTFRTIEEYDNTMRDLKDYGFKNHKTTGKMALVEHHYRIYLLLEDIISD